LKVEQAWVYNKRTHLSLITLPETRWRNRWSEVGVGAVEAGVVEVVDTVGVMEGSRLVGAGIVEGGVVTGPEGAD
jgi:hypothetical protein